MSRLFIFLFCILSLVGCSQRNTCKHGKPTQLFSAETAGIKNHSFSVVDYNSTEKMMLDSLFQSAVIKNGDTLYIPLEFTILQSGCEQVIQEFRLDFFDKIDPMPRDYSATDCADLVAEIFNKISDLDPKALAFSDLSRAILENLDKFEYGAAVKIGGGFSLQIDKIHSTESTMLSIIFKQAER